MRTALLISCSANVALLAFAFAGPLRAQEAGLAPPPTAAEMGLAARRGILHCHSHLSHDSKGTPERIVEACRAAGVDFVAMTDHPSPESLSEKALRGVHGGVLFLAGAETKQILAVHIREKIQGPDTQAAIRQATDQGGLAFLAHPEEIEDWSLEGYAGMEIYNLHSDTKDEDKGHLAVRGLAAYFEDPETCYLSFFDPPREFLARWDELGKRRRVVGIAGNDAHENIRLGRILLDPYERTFRFVATMVLVPDRDGPLDEATVLAALAAGRCYVAFGLPGPAAPVSFTARAARGTAAMGDELSLSGLRESVRFRAELPEEGRIVLLRDGAAVAEVTGRTLDRTCEGPGVYRVEAYRAFRGRELPWILTNPIYVR
ncbi:MAG: CehA/McbA family metallohydrolase [Planctomycetes bacterium]|nr:CehA/McbA family metallohydrolase [Planctomycetota bacterium]